MKRSKNFFKLGGKSNVEVFWNDVLIKPLCEKRVEIKNNDFDINPSTQKVLKNRKLTIKSLDDNEKDKVYDMVDSVGFYDIIDTKGLKSARMQDVIKVLPKNIQKIEILLHQQLNM